MAQSLRESASAKQPRLITNQLRATSRCQSRWPDSCRPSTVRTGTAVFNPSCRQLIYTKGSFGASFRSKIFRSRLRKLKKLSFLNELIIISQKFVPKIASKSFFINTLALWSTLHSNMQYKHVIKKQIAKNTVNESFDFRIFGRLQGRLM